MNKKFILKLFIILICQSSFATKQIVPNKVVTCSANQCPMVPDVLNSNEKLIDQAIIFETSPNNGFFVRYIQHFSNKDNGGWQYIILDEKAYVNTHPIVGFGGSFTDSVSMLYQHMDPFLQKALIDSYFSNKGLAYSLGRVPIASNDFSCRSLVRQGNEDIPVPSLTSCVNVYSCYSYADQRDDTLNNFSLQPEDINFKIPMIRAAIDAVRSNKQNELRLFASPWSAPAWMKTNGSMVHGSLDANFQQIWADYIVKFLQAYLNNQIRFWGLTVQNEPVDDGLGKGVQSWQTMYLTQEQEANFIKNYLGPTLKKFAMEYGSDIHIMIHDDQITTIQQRVSMLDDPEVAQYVSGAGLHWYTNFDFFYTNLDKAYQIMNQQRSQQSRFILGTEACEGYLQIGQGPSFGSWSRGESYAHDIINDLNHHVSGWTDWNLLLDMQGGPNWAKNYVDAPILVDLSKQEFYRQPMFYYLGHFSKFIRPESKLLASESLGPFPLEEVSFYVPAHDDLPETIVIVVLNRDMTGRNYYVKDNSITDANKFLNMYIPAHSIQTIIYRSRAAQSEKPFSKEYKNCFTLNVQSINTFTKFCHAKLEAGWRDTVLTFKTI